MTIEIHIEGGDHKGNISHYSITNSDTQPGFNKIVITKYEREILFKKLAKELGYAILKIDKEEYEARAKMAEIFNIPFPKLDTLEEQDKAIKKLEELVTNVHDKLDYKITRMNERLDKLEQDIESNRDD